MSASKARPMAPFTYIWKIENFSDLTYIDLKSPNFVIKSISNAVWCLHMDEYADFFCQIHTNDVEETGDGIHFEFSFLGPDGLPLISKTSSAPLLFLTLMKREEFLARLTEFLPNDTLTVRCQMWRNDCVIPIRDICYARTKLKTHIGSFIWAVEEFSTLPSSTSEDFMQIKSDEKRFYTLKPITKRGPFMALILYVTKYSESEYVYVDFLIEKGRAYAYSCELSILDANRKVIVTQIERGRTDYEWAALSFTRFISKSKLVGNKNLLLPNDTLLLKCSFEVCTGVISSENEYFTSNVTSVVEKEEAVLYFHVAEMEADVTLKFGEYFVKELGENV